MTKQYEVKKYLGCIECRRPIEEGCEKKCSRYRTPEQMKQIRRDASVALDNEIKRIVAQS